MNRRRIVLVGVALCELLLPFVARAQTADDLFNDQSLHRLDLSVNSRDWDELKAHFQDDEYYPADVTWRGLRARNVGIRSRGFGSRSGTKPGLRVDFDRYAGDQTFLGLKSFILDNLTQDPSGMRERVAMRFYQRMGLPAPREAHVQLYINNEYAGLYAIVESIDKDFLRRVFGQNANGIENDGHLFEYEYVSEWYFNDRGAGLDVYATLFDPVTHENASTYELYEPIAAMVRAINETSDASFVSEVSAYLDLAVFMRHVAVQNFMAEWDGVLGYAGVNNFYLYRFEDSRRSQFINWDADNTFRAVDFPITEGHEQNVLMRRAMQVPELRAVYFGALLEAAATASEPVAGTAMGWLAWEVARQHALISSAMLSDPFKPYTNDEFAEAAAAVSAFANGRTPFVTSEAAASGVAQFSRRERTNGATLSRRLTGSSK